MNNKIKYTTLLLMFVFALTIVTCYADSPGNDFDHNGEDIVDNGGLITTAPDSTIVESETTAANKNDNTLLSGETVGFNTGGVIIAIIIAVAVIILVIVLVPKTRDKETTVNNSIDRR